MNIKVEKDFLIEHVVPRVDEESYIVRIANKNTMFGSTEVNLDASRLRMEEIELMYDIAKSQQHKSLMSQITAFRSLVQNPDEAKISSLRSLVPGLVSYFTNNVIDGWLYQVDENGIAHPYLILKVEFHEADRTDDRPRVTIHLGANTPHNLRSGRQYYTETITISNDDIHKATIPEILAKRGFYHETPELKAMYEEHLDLFRRYQPKFNDQFYITGQMVKEFGYFKECFNTVRAKAVNDEGILIRRFTENVDPTFWRDRYVEEKFEDLPFHCYVYMFHLELHTNVWVHVSQMEPYVYDRSLKDKLVLPQDHRDLIDILVQDLDILQSDIIEGKSGGTTILCVGEPGLGKTLTAEVYSEVIERPLYRVHSGQLGIKSTNVEENLQTILKRAARWNAVLLLDEADVYIRRRGDDMHHNAVVAAFLRTLEYFDGLLFMTTNRGDDVDDAILSRCIAVIKYQRPTAENAKRIWRVLADSFQVKLSDDLIEQLVEKFPNASGRDIKELLKLSSRYAKGKGIDLDLEVFRKCAQFRGLEAQQ